MKGVDSAVDELKEFCARTFHSEPWPTLFANVVKSIKDTRDKDIILKNDKGDTVNRLESMFLLGTSHAGNEECAIIHQAMRGLGVVHMDHQARI